MRVKPDLDSALARVQFLTVIEMICLAAGGIAAIALASFGPALIGLGACALVSRFASTSATRTAEDQAIEELGDR